MGTVRASGKHPVGLAVLAATELAERFSYYGMTALLSLFMVNQLLLPGHAEHVLGLAGLRSLFEFRGPMSDLAFASLIYGWYGGLVYFTPILGGWVADRWLGKKLTVVAGALLMSAGHIAMTFDQTFLIALLLLILGSGALKGNIAAQVGKLYPEDSESLRERGFTIFSTAINIGAVAGPLGTGTVQVVYGFHAGFALAAVLMLIALGVYLAGSRFLPDQRPARAAAAAGAPPLTPEEKKRTWLLVAIIALLVPVSVTYTMIWNIGIIWVDQHVNLASPLGSVPASWFNSIDSFASIVVAPFLVGMWAAQARRKKEPAAMTKIAIGAAITGASGLLLTLGALTASSGKVAVIWPLLAWFGMGVGFMWYWPIMLALMSKAAPPQVNGTLIGGGYLALFFGSAISGWIGSFYDQMSNAAFWTLDAVIALASALVILALKKPVNRILELCED